GAENASVSPFGDIVNISGNSKVQLVSNDTIRSLTVNTNGTFIIPTGVACKTGEIFMPGGTIDMAGGGLVTAAGGSSQFSFRTLLTRGRNNGSWNGTNAGGSINSSLAAASALGDGVGYGLGSEIRPTSIGPFAIAASDTLIRYTLDGDANLDTTVDTIDFNILAANFAQP